MQKGNFLLSYQDYSSSSSSSSFSQSPGSTALLYGTSYKQGGQMPEVSSLIVMIMFARLMELGGWVSVLG